MFIFLQFVGIAAKSLIDFVLFDQIAQTHLLSGCHFFEIATNRTSVFVQFYVKLKLSRQNHLELLQMFKTA